MNKNIIIIIIIAIIICLIVIGAYFSIQTKNNDIKTYALNEKDINNLTLNMTKWNYDEKNDIYYQINVSYCTKPAALEYETLGIYVPGKYFDGVKNNNGTYNCTLNTKNQVGNYSSENAPIVIPINTPGYSAQTAPTSYNPKEVKEFTDSGIIYVYPGCRGRDSGENFTGGAPWGVTDIKASIMYLRFNNDVMPGDTEKIFTFGHSGGGAQSAIVGSSGDSELYDPYLEKIGAAMTDINGNVISNRICGAMCWCPITNLDTADAGYEWYMGQYSRSNDTWTYELSNDLARKYGEYINNLSLKDTSGKVLTLEESENGIYNSGSYYDYQLKIIEESLNNFLADTSFPYTPQSEMEPMDGAPNGDQAPSGEIPSENPPNHNNQNTETATNSSSTYQTAQDYINSLNSDGQWVEYNASTNTAKVKSIEDFVKHCKPASKDVGAFDDLNRSQAENKLFGNNKSGDSLHFDSIMSELLNTNSEKYSKLSGYDPSYAEQYSSDIKLTDILRNTVDKRVDMYNPMYYLCDYYKHSTSTPAKHWRINSGIEQGDTATTVETNLDLALNQNPQVNDVELNVVWGQGHTQAERTGNSTSNFISWINQCVR